MRLLCISLLFLLAGCSIIEKDETIGWSVQQLYGEAKASLKKGDLMTARKYYQKILARYPYGRYAQQTHLDLIQLEYKDQAYDKAVLQAKKYVRLYPNSPYADYARYMKGVVTYSRDVSIIDKLVPTNIAQSDQSLMKNAFEDFSELVGTSPSGDYSEDAKMRMIFLRNITAEHEIYVAEYYLRRGAYLAAANRGQYVVKHFDRTPSVPLALGVMVRAYQELNMPKLAQDAKRILDKNFPKAASGNERLDFILNGDISKKKSFLKVMSQKLLTN
ncbi:MAG: outer membrane protein assembly factor BamD [Gammaproteobacteria bacterium]|nr:MAG: outer membrane protein assembly factor BamD [Gammaproteobacteria bacterium]